MEESPGFLGKEGCPGGTGSNEATPGALSHPRCLWELPGPSCPNSMENHLEAVVIVRETDLPDLPETPQGRSGELPLNSFPWLCPGAAAPLGAVDGRTRRTSGDWCPPSTLSLVLGTFRGVQV